jgi:hypothetical protein
MNPMKITNVLLVTVLLTLVAPHGLAAGDRFEASLAAQALFPADAAYKETYGNTVVHPELKASFTLVKNLYAWAGFALAAASGETPVLKEAADTRQSFLSAGAGLRLPLSGGWGLFAELGLASVHYREEALGLTLSGSALGFAANAGVRRDLGAHFFLLAQAGYVYAKKTLDGDVVKLGGAKAGIGAGVRF